MHIRDIVWRPISVDLHRSLLVVIPGIIIIGKKNCSVIANCGTLNPYQNYMVHVSKKKKEELKLKNTQISLHFQVYDSN